MKLDDGFDLVHGASVWQTACALANKHGAVFPACAPSVCVAVVPRPGSVIELPTSAHWSECGYVVASVGAVQTDASLVLFEWLVTNPLYSPVVRHRAVEHLMRAGLVYSTAVGKRPVMLNVPRGVRQIAERIGFASSKSFECLMGEMP